MTTTIESGAKQKTPPNKMAKIYLREARATIHRSWKISLLIFAQKHRCLYFDFIKSKTIKKEVVQKDLFM